MVDGTEKIVVNLDSSLDDIDDLPQFVVPLSGAYTMTVDGWESKTIKDHPAISVDFTIVEVHEVTDTPEVGDSVPKAGDKFNIPYMLDNKVGAGLWKSDLLVPVATHFGLTGATKTEIMNAVKGATALVIMKRTYSKDKDRYFPKLVKFQIA